MKTKVKDGLKFVQGIFLLNGWSQNFRLEICPGNKRDGRTLFARIEKRDSRNLLARIVKHVELGTTIYTDCWGACNGLTELGFSHYTVNHSQHFVDPDTGTQMIDSPGVGSRRDI